METNDLGTTKSEEKEELARTGNLFANRFTDFGVYTHRVLSKPKRVEYITYPTLTESQETGELVQTWNRIYLPKRAEGETLIDKLAKADKTIQVSRGADPKRTYSIFDRRTRYLYIVISRDLSEEEIVITHWEYPETVARGLSKLQKELSSRDPKYLKYGPYYAYDVLIEKAKNEERYRKTGKEWMATTYNVSPDVEFLAEKGILGKIPKEAIENKDWKGKTKLLNLVFTEDELKAIDDYPYSVDDLVTVANTDESIQQIFNSSPLYLFAKNASDVPVFQYADELAEFLSKNLINVEENELLSNSEEDSNGEVIDSSNDLDSAPFETEKEEKPETAETEKVEDDEELDW